MVICLERGADLHMSQLMPLPLTVSCFSKIWIVFTFLLLAQPDSPGQRAIKQVCVSVYVYAQADIALLTEEAHSSIRRFVDSLPLTLKHQTYQPILFDFSIWSKCHFPVCIGELNFIFVVTG